MDRILASLFGQTVHAYVDDMVVTSMEKEQHVFNLEELFAWDVCVWGPQIFVDWEGHRGQPKQMCSHHRNEEPHHGKGGPIVNRMYGDPLTLGLPVFPVPKEK